MSYHSEHKQDLWLNAHIFHNKRNGIFVEAGAIDGVITSNTLFFEKELGWSGLCVEPIPEMFKKLEQNRNCICENYALSHYEGTELFYVYPKVIGWSGLARTMEKEHLNRMADNGGDRDLIKVKGIQLETLLERYALYNIDYMSIDIEGAEVSVLWDFPFDHFNIGILDIENNYGALTKDTSEALGSFKDRLNDWDYTKIATLEINDIYRRNDYVV
jgi:FkbM family methyltransferase